MAPVAAFVNHVLAQHAWARDRLRPHAGKTLRIDATPFTLTLAVTDGGEVEAVPPVLQSDVAFRVDPARLPLMLADPDSALKAVHLSGDAEFAQAIASLMREVRWDAEEDLSRMIGDVPAWRLMRAARSFADWGRDAARRLAGTTAAFLVDEEPLLVRREMAEAQAVAIAEARDACARLERRIELIEAARRQKAAP